MARLEKISHCEQCGAPLQTGATNRGCLNCLMLGGPNEPSFETSFQHYEICRHADGTSLYELGRGAMGITYRAVHVNLGSYVALKIISGQYSENPRMRERFQREAQAAAQLRHANVASVYHFGETPTGQYFYVMELVEGETLEARARREGPLPVLFALEVAIQVARALTAAEDCGLVHRDLKPGNVMVVATDPTGVDSFVVKVIDFGLAKAVAALPSTSGQNDEGFSGTPDFASPEQFCRGEVALDVRSDIYSLGATLWYSLTGNAPHADRELGEAPDPTLPLEQLAARKVPSSVVALLCSMLAAHPAARPQSARELLTALQRCRQIVERRPLRRKQRRIAALGFALLLIGAAPVANHLSHQRTFRHSVAVLPILDLDTASASWEFTKSLSSSLQTNIARLGKARILAVTEGKFAFAGSGTAEDLRAISSEANTRTALTGTVRTVGQKLSVWLRLVDATSQLNLWQRHFLFDNSSSSAATLAARIADEVFSALETEPPAGQSARDPILTNERASNYLRLGQDFERRMTPDDLDIALDSYRKAINAAPDSALARTNFAIAAIARGKMKPEHPELIDEAETLAKEAVTLKSAIGKSHRALALVHLVKGDPMSAREDSLVAIETSGPRGATAFLGNIARAAGRPDIALKWYLIAKHWKLRPATDDGLALADPFIDSEAVELDQSIGDCWADLGEDARAEKAYRLVAQFNPDLPNWESICRLRLLEGDFDSARQMCQKNPSSGPKWFLALGSQTNAQVQFFSRAFGAAERSYNELEKWNPGGSGPFYGAISYQSALGRLMMLRGADADGRKILEACLQTEEAALTKDQQPAHARYRIAAIEASLGEIEEAIRYLASASDQGWVDYRSLELDPRFDSIRQDSRYPQIVDSMKTRMTELRLALVRELDEADSYRSK